MSLKERISSPLEAGTSVLDAHNLPPHLNAGLEYASNRLARKGLHITLVVVRHEYQLPQSSVSFSSSSAFSALSSPLSPPASAASTPARPSFAAAPVATLKRLVRANTLPQERTVQTTFDIQRSGMVSPAFSEASTASSASTADSTFTRSRWPFAPMSPTGHMPMTPATPAYTIASSAPGTTTDDSSVASGLHRGSQPFAIKLVHVSPLSLREEKMLGASMEKAGKKFGISPDWLPQATSPSSCGLNADVVHRSLAQNEVVSSSEGLTLLALDHLYTFKAALVSYSRTLSPSRLEDAVDELRRLILAQGRRKLLKSTLLSTYAWLGSVRDAALSDVCRMYRRAYGGLEGEGGVENDLVPYNDCSKSPISAPSTPLWPLPACRLPSPGMFGPDFPKEEEVAAPEAAANADRRRAGFYSEDGIPELALEPEAESETEADLQLEQQERERERERALALEEMRLRTPKLSPPPPPRGAPLLKLQTNFAKPVARRAVPAAAATAVEEQKSSETAEIQIHIQGEDDDEEEERTARPRARPFWTNSVSIDEILSPSRGSGLLLGGGGGSADPGPMTPNGYEDISPITRGEWGFLMVAQSSKTAAVETC